MMIDEAEAKRRREEINEADFWGMDGSSRYSFGDAIARLLSRCNILGGI